MQQSLQQLLKGLATGLVSGAISWMVATQTLGITSAIAMPQGVALAVWETVVVFGLGATVVSLLVHALALAGCGGVCRRGDGRIRVGSGLRDGVD